MHYKTQNCNDFSLQQLNYIINLKGLSRLLSLNFAVTIIYAFFAKKSQFFKRNLFKNVL